MAFTFNSSPFDDIGRVRFAIGDTDSSSAIFTDELIDGLIDEHGGWQEAAIAAVENIITQLLMPDFTADWLKVDNSKAVAGYTALLARLESKYGSSEATFGVDSVEMLRDGA